MMPSCFFATPFLIVEWLWYSGKLTKLRSLRLIGAFDGTMPTEM
jgi:hypothetical protein